MSILQKKSEGIEALLWGFISAESLLIRAALALRSKFSQHVVGLSWAGFREKVPPLLWQFFSQTFPKLSVLASASRKGNPYDNAVMKSFYRTLKRGLLEKKKLLIG